MGGEWFFLAKPVRALIDRLRFAEARNGPPETEANDGSDGGERSWGASAG